jgi:Flp pilus assembly pilin Flp
MYTVSIKQSIIIIIVVVVVVVVVAVVVIAVVVVVVVDLVSEFKCRCTYMTSEFVLIF